MAGGWEAGVIYPIVCDNHDNIQLVYILDGGVEVSRWC